MLSRYNFKSSDIGDVNFVFQEIKSNMNKQTSWTPIYVAVEHPTVDILRGSKPQTNGLNTCLNTLSTFVESRCGGSLTPPISQHHLNISFVLECWSRLTRHGLNISQHDSTNVERMLRPFDRGLTNLKLKGFIDFWNCYLKLTKVYPILNKSPFRSYLLPLFQSESWCETIQLIMKMRLTCAFEWKCE